MDDTRLGAVESQFADIIWKNAPLSSRDLVKLMSAAAGMEEINHLHRF